MWSRTTGVGGSAVTLRCDVVWYTYLCREWLFWGVLQRLRWEDEIPYIPYLTLPYGTGQIGGSGFFGSQKLKLVSTLITAMHARTHVGSRETRFWGICVYT